MNTNYTRDQIAAALSDCKAAHLKQLCKDADITGRGSMLKADMVDVLASTYMLFQEQQGTISGLVVDVDFNKFAPNPSNETPSKKASPSMNKPSVSKSTDLVTRAQELVLDTMAHPQVADKSPEGIAKRVARHLNKEGFDVAQVKGFAKYFTSKAVIALLADPTIAATAATAAPEPVSLLDGEGQPQAEPVDSLDDTGT